MKNNEDIKLVYIILSCLFIILSGVIYTVERSNYMKAYKDFSYPMPILYNNIFIYIFLILSIGCIIVAIKEK